MHQIVSQHQCPSEDSFSKDAMSASEEKQISSALLLTLRIPDSCLCTQTQTTSLSTCSSVCVNRWKYVVKYKNKSVYCLLWSSFFKKLLINDRFHMNRTICCLDLCFQKNYYISVIRSYCIRHVDRYVCCRDTVRGALAADLCAFVQLW